jgi:hypothetical protein
MAEPHELRLEPDAQARAWLESHPSQEARVIAYEVHRCCGGGKICQVRFRTLSSRDDAQQYVPGTLDDGSVILVDRRAAARLPAKVGLKVRGRGRLKHLDLDLAAEQWGTLLYD